MPHRKSHVLADVAKGGPEHVQQAIDAANAAHADWSRMPWHERAAVFLRAAELLAGPWRSTLNAATMLNQSKTAHQAEIDAVCEMVDFWRYNVDFILRDLLRAAALADRDLEPDGVPAARGLRLRGQPVQLQLHRRQPLVDAGAHGLHDRLEAGLDRRALGVLLHAPPAGGRPARRRHQPRLRLRRDDRERRAREPRPRRHPLHRLDRGLQRHVGDRRRRTSRPAYRGYPRLVGETGGKDFILAHPSADAEAVATAVVRGSFEYQGQKCSAASRLYVPSNLWPEVKERLVADVGDDPDGRPRRLRELHGRRHRRERLQDARATRSPRRARRARRSSPAARRTTPRATSSSRR